MFDIFVDLRRISACIVHKNIYFSILFYYLIDHCLYFRTYGKVMGKGGGRTDMIQGFLRGNEEDLRVWIQEKVRKQKNE